MIGPEGPGSPPPAREAEAQVAFAIMRQRIAETHLAAAIEMIERAAGEVEPPRTLDIYGRLQHLGEDDFQHLKNAVLAHYGRAAEGLGEKPPTTFVAITGDVEWDVTASLFRRMKKRLGGRRNVELRRWMELHTGRTQMKLFRLHVDGALQVAQLLEASSLLEAVHHYNEAMHVRDELAEAIYIAVADRLFELEAMKPAPAEEAEDDDDGFTLRLIQGA